VAGFDRGVRPIGDWSMSMTLSKCSSPSIRSCGAGASEALCSRRAAALYSVSTVKVDLPPPDTPVMQVKVPTGISPVTPFRLLPVAPMTFSTFFLEIGRRSSGTSISRTPDRYWPVMLSGLAVTSAGVPWAMIWPPCTPAAGPMSIT
jgi:hypothetical protein